MTYVNEVQKKKRNRETNAALNQKVIIVIVKKKYERVLFEFHFYSLILLSN